MNRNAQSSVTSASRPNRILVVLAAVWMAAAIALGGLFTAEPSDASASGSTTGVARSAQP